MWKERETNLSLIKCISQIFTTTFWSYKRLRWCSSEFSCKILFSEIKYYFSSCHFLLTLASPAHRSKIILWYHTMWYINRSSTYPIMPKNATWSSHNFKYTSCDHGNHYVHTKYLVSTSWAPLRAPYVDSSATWGPYDVCNHASLFWE